MSKKNGRPPKQGRGDEYLWLAVSRDKYEFPLLICDSLTELAEKTGKTETNIRSIVSKAEKKEAQNKGLAHSSFRRVPKEDITLAR